MFERINTKMALNYFHSTVLRCNDWSEKLLSQTANKSTLITASASRGRGVLFSRSNIGKVISLTYSQ